MEMKLAENIRAFRKERSLTQEQLAEVLGVTESTVQVRAFRLRARVLQKIRESLGGKEDAVCRETIPMN